MIFPDYVQVQHIDYPFRTGYKGEVEQETHAQYIPVCSGPLTHSVFRRNNWTQLCADLQVKQHLPHTHTWHNSFTAATKHSLSLVSLHTPSTKQAFVAYLSQVMSGVDLQEQGRRPACQSVVFVQSKLWPSAEFYSASE